MAFDPKKYPDHWEHLKALVWQRAGGRCEYISHDGTRCNCTAGAEGFRDDAGHFIQFAKGAQGRAEKLKAEALGFKPVKIILTVGHMDQDEWNDEVKLDRLKLWCQKHHLNHDQEDNQERKLVKRYKNSLFPYYYTKNPEYGMD